jgi:hypothetical protein
MTTLLTQRPGHGGSGGAAVAAALVLGALATQ